MIVCFSLTPPTLTPIAQAMTHRVKAGLGIIIFKLTVKTAASQAVERLKKPVHIVVVVVLLFQISASASWQQAVFSETPSTGDRMRSP